MVDMEGVAFLAVALVAAAVVAEAVVIGLVGHMVLEVVDMEDMVVVVNLVDTEDMVVVWEYTGESPPPLGTLVAMEEALTEATMSLAIMVVPVIVMGDMVAVVWVVVAAMEVGLVVMTLASGAVMEVAVEAPSLEVEGDMVVQGGTVGIILTEGRRRFSEVVEKM